MQPDPEHQQDHADLGELRRQPRVGDEAGRKGADQYPGEQIAQNGGQAQARGDQAENEGEAEARRDRQKEIDIMGHVSRGIAWDKEQRHWRTLEQLLRNGAEQESLEP